MNNVLSGGDFWAPNPDGTTQVKKPAANATYVDFTNVPYGDYGYYAFIDMATAATPTTKPITLKDDGTGYAISNISNGTCTVRLNFTSPVTAAQANAEFTLRILR